MTNAALTYTQYPNFQRKYLYNLLGIVSTNSAGSDSICGDEGSRGNVSRLEPFIRTGKVRKKKLERDWERGVKQIKGTSAIKWRLKLSG